MGCIYAGIVTYNPNIERLKENLYSIINQVEKTIIVDNNSNNIDQIEELVCKFRNVKIITNKSNYGIAKALNQIMQESLLDGCEWTMLLDQDSICPSNIIDTFKQYIIRDQLLGIIAPVIKDLNDEIENKVYEEKFEYINQCITSGSLTRCSIWKELNGFNEDLFIDCVDDDYCIRLYNLGYKIIRVNEISLIHEIGKKTKHKLFSTYNHSAFRKYYMTRNTIYCARKYGKYAKVHCSSRHEVKRYINRFNGLPSLMYAYLRILKRMLIVILYEKDKVKKINSMIKGVIDGCKICI